jgi:hypothetical protein
MTSQVLYIPGMYVPVSHNSHTPFEVFEWFLVFFGQFEHIANNEGKENKGIEQNVVFSSIGNGTECLGADFLDDDAHYHSWIS